MVQRKRVENALRDKGVSLGKLYFSTLFKDKYLQVYVYDYVGRDWALNHVINYLVEEKLITLR